MWDKHQILLLNASYEPLGVIGVQRAICLQFRGQVSVEEYHPTAVLHSPTETWKVPYVVRLRDYIDVRKRKRNSQMKRSRIYLRDKRKCAYCKGRFTDKDLTLDHIIPKSRGGTSSPENLITSCLSCNQRKADRTPEEAGMPLNLSPRHLITPLDKVVSVDLANRNPVWKKYMGMTDDSEGDSRFQHRD